MKTEINGRDNQLVSYWPKGEREDAEVVRLLMQLTSLDITATLSADSYGPVVNVERNGHTMRYKAGTLLVVHNKNQLSVLDESLVEKLRLVLQLDEQATVRTGLPYAPDRVDV